MRSVDTALDSSYLHTWGVAETLGALGNSVRLGPHLKFPSKYTLFYKNTVYKNIEVQNRQKLGIILE